MKSQTNEGKTMKRNRKDRIKSRNWLAVHAFQRSGAGRHKDKSKYNRKSKHKQQLLKGE
jgi:hypothetical protein